ncbi:acyl carrier protein [Streptomyces nondiastaticus]|uniref:acyl carrier protein n=1 Tax=Streptomyces nondiastaticus TaxID=3154512 RepID=UPI00341C7660
MTTSAQPDTVRERTRAYMEEYIGQRIGDDEDIFAAGLASSLFVIQLVTFVEEAFGVTVHTEELTFANFGSPDAVTRFVAAKAAQEEVR